MLATLVLGLSLGLPAQAGPAMFQASLDILWIGTNAGPAGATARHFHLPFDDVCNPYFPGGTTCSPTRVENGTPLTGSGAANVFGSGPAAFTLPKAAIARSFSGAFPTHYPTYLGSFVSGHLYNDAVATTPGGGPGFFGPGAGAGSLTHAYSPASYGVARVVAGAERFGGLMGLRGGATLFRDLYFTPPVAGSRPIVTGFGAIGITPAIGRTNGYTASVVRHLLYFERGRYRSVAYPVLATGFRWTTGTVYAYDAVGRYASRFTLAGYDQRTPMGLGTLQLVTPFLAHWALSPAPDHVAGVASLRIRFAPEPHATLLLAAGIGLLAALRGYASSRRTTWLTSLPSAAAPRRSRAGFITRPMSLGRAISSHTAPPDGAWPTTVYPPRSYAYGSASPMTDPRNIRARSVSSL
ncbi:MAG: hypothetical protein OEY15_07375 [Myxococcales bacterium]|nr:hypothetical protein [Myxococcales bacterium]